MVFFISVYYWVFILLKKLFKFQIQIININYEYKYNFEKEFLNN